MWKFVCQPLPVTGKSTQFFFTQAIWTKWTLCQTSAWLPGWKTTSDLIWTNFLVATTVGKKGWRELCLGNATHIEQRRVLMPSRCLFCALTMWRPPRHEKTSKMRLHLILAATFFPEGLPCLFFLGCLGLDILATRDAIRLFVEMANLLLNHC